LSQFADTTLAQLNGVISDATLGTASDFATAAQGSTADSAVQNTGNETVAGVKTFSSSPIIPAPSTDLQAATKKYVDDNAGGTVDVLSNVATARIIGRTTAGTGNSEELTATAARTLLNVEDGADVTDATNVQAAGALMDSEVTNLAQVKAFDSADYATAAQGSTADSAVQDTGDETIAGIKTFSSSPIVPAPTTDLQAATKKYVDDNGGGGDLWSDDVDSDIIPDGDNTRDIGSPSAIFSQVHSRSVFTANLVAETTNMGMLNNNDDAIVAFYAPDNAVNYVRFVASLTGVAAKIEANSDVDANVDINLVPKGTGDVVVPTLAYDQATATVSALGSVGSSETVNASLATVFTATLDANCSFTFSNLTAGRSIELHLYGDGTQRTPTFPTAKLLYNDTTISYPTTTSELLVLTVRHNGTDVVISAGGNYAAFS